MRGWPSFMVDGQRFDLAHLNDFVLEAEDSSRAVRRMLVTFSDHCFTREPNDGLDAAPIFPGCSRGPDGRFSTERYALSLRLPDLIRATTQGVVWNMAGDHYAIVTKMVDGARHDYAIVFSLDPIKGLSDIRLHMRVRTAHERPDHQIDTFGSVRFAHLLKLRFERRRPTKVYDRHRRRPK